MKIDEDTNTQNNSIIIDDKPIDIQRLTYLKQQQRSTTIDDSQKPKETQSKQQKSKPFQKTIEALQEIPKLTSPMRKLEFIYQIFNTLMVEEIDEFWEGVEIDKKKLSIDYENLNGIAIYLALKASIPVLIIDIIFIENFVSKAIMFTNRAYNMTVLHSALMFVEDNLPNYCETKEKRNPLKESMTPQFINIDNNLLLSPRSQGQNSVLMSKLLDNQGPQYSDIGKKESHDFQGLQKIQDENEDDLLFEFEKDHLDIKRFQTSKDKPSQQSMLEKENTSSNQSSSQQLLLFDNDAVESGRGNDDNQSLKIMSYQSKSNIKPDAAKTIHKIVAERLQQKQQYSNHISRATQHASSNLNHQSLSTKKIVEHSSQSFDYQNDLILNTQQSKSSNQNSPSKTLRNINIYQDNEKLLDSFYNNFTNIRNNHLDQDEMFRQKMERLTAQFKSDDFKAIHASNKIDQQIGIIVQDSSLNKTVDLTKSYITQ